MDADEWLELTTSAEAEAVESVSAVFAEFGQGVAKGLHTEVVAALGPFHAVNERGEVNELEAGVNEVEVEQLLACHKIVIELPTI